MTVIQTGFAAFAEPEADYEQPPASVRLELVRVLASGTPVSAGPVFVSPEDVEAVAARMPWRLNERRSATSEPDIIVSYGERGDGYEARDAVKLHRFIAGVALGEELPPFVPVRRQGLHERDYRRQSLYYHRYGRWHRLGGEVKP